MKKIVLLFFGMFLLTGCTKNLTCTKEETESGVKNITQVTAKYNDKEIKKLDLYLEMELVNEKETDKETFDFSTTVLESFYDEYSEEGITVKETKEDKKYALNINYKKEKMSNLKRILNVKMSTGAELKKSLERDNYVCK